MIKHMKINPDCQKAFSQVKYVELCIIIRGIVDKKIV